MLSLREDSFVGIALGNVLSTFGEIGFLRVCVSVQIGIIDSMQSRTKENTMVTTGNILF